MSTEYPTQSVIRLTVYLPDELVEQIKLSAVKRGHTLSEWVKRAALVQFGNGPHDHGYSEGWADCFIKTRRRFEAGELDWKVK